MNNTTKHTPGPWVVTPNHAESVEDERLNITVGDQLIAEIHHAWIDWDEYDANAALIAAAPAMYEALVETMKVLRSLRDSKEEWYTLVTPELLTAWDKNKAALAQAEGSKP